MKRWWWSFTPASKPPAFFLFLRRESRRRQSKAPISRQLPADGGRCIFPQFLFPAEEAPQGLPRLGGHVAHFHLARQGGPHAVHVVGQGLVAHHGLPV